MLTREIRLEKYLGVLGHKDSYICSLTEHACKNFHFGGFHSDPNRNASIEVQMNDIKELLPNTFSDYFGLYQLGDISKEASFPVITKTRPITRKQNNNIITFIETGRHWGLQKGHVIDAADDIDWCDKKSTAIWRGAITNAISKYNPRCRLVQKFFNHPTIDVGFTSPEDAWMLKPNISKKYLKPMMAKRRMREYKYLISIEGNDVASNLRWAMNSKSLVLMPIPTCESWFLESCLIPWVHYVPINETMDDLENKIEWCNNNSERCQQIVKNANNYVSIFLDFEEEKKLSTRVIENYFSRLTFTCGRNLRIKYGHLLENKKNIKFL